MTENELRDAVRSLMLDINETTYYVPYRDQFKQNAEKFLCVCADLTALGESLSLNHAPKAIAERALVVAYSALRVAEGAAITAVMDERNAALARSRESLAQLKNGGDVA